VTLADFDAMVVTGGDGVNDTLRVDFSGGQPFPAGGLTFNGGDGGSDALGLTGGTFGSVTHRLTGPGSGSIDLNSDGSLDVRYGGLEPITTTGLGTANLTFILAAGITDAVLEDHGAAADGNSQLRFTNQSLEDVFFANPATSLTIGSSGPSSVVRLLTPDTGFAPATLTVRNATLLVDGATTQATSLSVEAGGVLGGTGTVGGEAMIHAGAKISGGAAGEAGTLRLGGLRFDGGVYQADLAGAVSDTLIVSGVIQLASPAQGSIALNATAGPLLVSHFTLIDNTSAGPISNAPLTGAPEGAFFQLGGQDVVYSYRGNDRNDFVLFAPVGVFPDPAHPGQNMLVVNGTGVSETISVQRGPRGAHVARIRSREAGGLLNQRRIVQGALSRIVLNGFAGNDDLSAGISVKVAVSMNGGVGNDRLRAGLVDSVLLGGDGNDVLIGSVGRDILIGGRGVDRLLGDDGQDILIGGTTDHDTSDAALAQIVREWSDRTVIFQDRVARLMAAGLLTDATVHANLERDRPVLADSGKRDLVLPQG